MKFVILILVIVIVLLIHEVNKLSDDNEKLEFKAWCSEINIKVLKERRDFLKEYREIKLKDIESLKCEIKDLKEENRILKHDLDIMFSMATDCRYEEEEE